MGALTPQKNPLAKYPWKASLITAQGTEIVKNDLSERTTLCNYNKILSISLDIVHIPFQEEIPKHFIKSYKFILPESKINDLNKLWTFQEQYFSWFISYPKY